MNTLRKMKIWLIILLVILTGALFLLNGCGVVHVQATAGVGERGVESATALSSGKAWSGWARPARD